MKTDTPFASILARMDKLPTLPGIAIKILEAFQKEEPDLSEIGEIISTDPSLSSEVLKIINSSFYGMPSKITSVFHAIKLLGINAVKNLALSFSLVHNFRTGVSDAFDYTVFWKDSLIAAVATRIIAEKVLPKYSEDAFFLGLLHNIGILTLVQCLPKQYSLVLKDTESTDHGYQEAEDQVLGFNHMAVGEYLVKSWGLPPIFYLPIGSHHNPARLVAENSDIRQLARILHLSALYINFFNAPNARFNLSLIEYWAENYGLSNRIHVDEIGLSIHEQTRNIFPLFEIDLKAEDDYVRILETARQELIELTSDVLAKMLDLKHEIESLRKQVIRDGMTRLYNYQHFYELLHNEIYRAGRYGFDLSLIIADIDDFKAVNDTYGHVAGDLVIKAVADCFRESIRTSDQAARYGGEEFAAILPETSLQGALTVADRLRQMVADRKIVHAGKSIAVTMSVGVASVPQGEKIPEEKLVKQADQALYRAKKSGKNRVCVFEG